MQNKTKFSPLKNSSKSLLINKVQDTDRRSSHVKKVVKAKNLIAFRIWLEKLGYSVKTLLMEKVLLSVLKRIWLSDL